MSRSPVTAELMADAVNSYKDSANFQALLERIGEIAGHADSASLAAAAEPFRDMPEVTGPVYEHIVAERPDDARSLVILANAYWLTGRGPQAVQDLVSRAIAADPDNRGAWHLWALTESSLRERVARWEQVVTRFPNDELARVNLADNAASLASTEHDESALEKAIAAYESLLLTAGQ
ncbi:MAG: hypothetical protein ABR543_07495, partial [Gemmatimonadaceae bacterium]